MPVTEAREDDAASTLIPTASVSPSRRLVQGNRRFGPPTPLTELRQVRQHNHQPSSSLSSLSSLLSSPSRATVFGESSILPLKAGNSSPFKTRGEPSSSKRGQAIMSNAEPSSSRRGSAAMVSSLAESPAKTTPRRNGLSSRSLRASSSRTGNASQAGPSNAPSSSSRHASSSPLKPSSPVSAYAAGGSSTPRGPTTSSGRPVRTRRASEKGKEATGVASGSGGPSPRKSVVACGQNGEEADAAEEEEVDEEKRKLMEKERELFEGWKEEYFEVVDQLPLEIHRSFTLMRELEAQIEGHLDVISKDTIAYRDYRRARHDRMFPSTKDSSTEASATTTGEAERPGEDGAKDGTTAPAEDPASASQVDAVEKVSQNGPTDSLEPLHSAPQSPPSTSKQPYLRHAALESISKATSSALAASEEKVGLALSTYRLIDRQCRRLDADLARMTGGSKGVPAATDALASTSAAAAPGGIRDGTMESSISRKMGGAGAVGSNSNDRGRSASSHPLQTDNKGSSSRKKGGRKSNAKEEEEISRPGYDDAFTNMAIDPNEPVYCYCRGPSFGLMIGCDNDECPYEWFHLSCLGLTVAPDLPEGKEWFCKECSAERGGGAGPSTGATDLKRKKSGKRKRAGNRW